ncbi:MAG: glycine--tRNA ligase subunit beta [Acidobacteria bacterium]|nr:glycine--tRNA ligase subunit beta [Acidobacteriota bacterium]MBA3884363.1 glycine--tRNA ligase subunit beta [Acidobacteriota bacterium]
MDRELLIEIGVEELPAAWMPSLTGQLAVRLEAGLRALRLAPLAPVESYTTPRRLTVRVARIPERQEDLDETLSGPPVSASLDKSGQPTAAALGFARKQGVAFEDLRRITTPKGEYLAFHRKVRGRSAVDTLPDVLTGLLRDLAFPKQMHWDAMLDDGRGELLFGRPIRWLLFLHGGRVVPYTIGRTPGAATSNVQEIQSGALTYGHRFLATSGRPGRSIKVRHFEEYQARLVEHYVVLSHDERRDRIARDLELHARRLGGHVQLKEHAALIDEVADLVEYPGVVAGFYDPAFLELPQEVLATTLVHHQHYFPIVNDAGALKEAFLAVVNTQPGDERVIARNAERVVTARLRDAKFFREADRRTPMASRLDRLDTLQFHKKLGSYRAKAERISTVAGWIATEAFGQAPEGAQAAKTAGLLAKCDLTTDMVFEFPELQGNMGGIYARDEGQPEEIWKSVYYQYLPVGVEADAPPSREQLGAASLTWAAVSLADKLDTFVSLTRAGERATGSRDPFGLRRQVQGVVRLLMDLPALTGLDQEIALGPLLDRAAAEAPDTAAPWAEVSQAAEAFALERVRFVLEHRGAPAEVARAATTSASVSPLRARRIAEAIQGMRGSDDFQALAVLFKRVKNITKELPAGVALDREALAEPAERALLEEVDARRPRVQAAAARRDYRAAFVEVAGLRQAVDRFFTDVFVMAEDPRLRQARLALVADLRNLIVDLADISEIVSQSE